MMEFEDSAELSDGLFKKFSVLLLERTGISLKEHKKYLLIHRLSKFVGPEKEFQNFQAYYEALLKYPDSPLMTGFVNVLTTNFSFFFREEVHFQFLKHYVQEKYAKEPYLHLWSAASSTGEEAYSMAITVLQALQGQGAGGKEIKILGTDISTRVLQIAHAGVYESGRVEGHLDARGVKHFFNYDAENSLYRVKPEVKELTVFRKLNLLKDYPFQKQFDVVFLRNVLIYFDNKEKEQAINRIYHTVKPGGYLIIGLSESMVGIHHPFTAVKNSIYHKKSDSGNRL